jgi:predicted P-loop ATPase
VLHDLTVPFVVVESPKSVLAIEAWARRTGEKILPLAVNGCWGWHGRIGKAENARGRRVDEYGMLPDLHQCCSGRRGSILFDSNASSKADVRRARRNLATELRKIKAEVSIIELTAAGGINGPDDFLKLNSDAAFAALLASGAPASKDGAPKGSLARALALLRDSPEWNGVLSYNEFTLRVTTKKLAPWQKTCRGSEVWTDYHDSRTTEWLQLHDVAVQTPTTSEAVQTVAKENTFHPVRDYLQSLRWDGRARLDQWLTDYLGVPDSAFVRAVGSRWLISACARIFRPGCQVDHVLLLEGPQGIRKSTALQTLAGDDWFTDHISDLGSKDSRIELHGKWIIEFSELSAVRRGDVERIKAFLTARVDNFRMPYGRRSEAVPRSCVFAASVNDQTPFTDPTGNRRFWPVTCGTIDIVALQRDRDQLWAEAYKRFSNGEVWWLDTDELTKAAALEQEARYEPGVWDEIILRWIENPVQAKDKGQGIHIPLEPFDSEPGRVTVTDILVHAMGKRLDHQMQADMNQVVRCLTHARWKRKQVRQGSTRRWYYVPP